MGIEGRFFTRKFNFYTRTNEYLAFIHGYDVDNPDEIFEKKLESNEKTQLKINANKDINVGVKQPTKRTNEKIVLKKYKQNMNNEEEKH